MNIRETILGGDPDMLAGIVPSKRDFEAAQSDFLGSVELSTLARGLVEAKFPELRDCTIGIYWQKKGAKSKGKAVLGKIQAPTGALKFHSGVDFLIHIAADHARAMRLTNWGLEAVVYHELCHAHLEPVTVKDGEEEIVVMVPRILGHDLEMFYTEVSEYGLWRNELRGGAEVFTQSQMPI